ncbi:MAG: hypothetical protein HYY34_05180 [Chloroflexi bacterium]|nr:hypothetical protein [Chloroflexota bacterium]
MRFATLIAGLAVLALVVALPGPRGALADGGAGQLTVIGVDMGAVARADRDADVALTAGSVVATSQKAGTVAFLEYGAVPSEIEAYQAGSTVQSGITSLAAAIDHAAWAPSDQMKAMSAAFEFLSDASAPSGSRAVMITSDGLTGQTPEGRDRLTAFAALFAQQGWSLDVVMLPSASPAARDFLTALAAAGAGKSYDAGALDGLSRLFADEAGFLGQPAIETQLGMGDSALASVEVAPHSESITITFLRFSPAASFELFDPRGAKADVRRNPAVKVFETPSAVVLQVASPEAGTWSLRAAGAGSEIRAAVEIANPLSLGLVPQPPIPAGQSGALAAAATVDGKPVALPGATVEATVRSTDGKAVVYRLLDDGRGVDEKAGDGVFTVAVPAASSQSLYEVGLRLSWANYGATIIGAGSFKIEQFPAIQVTPLSAAPVAQGAEAAIARVDVTVGQYPYPVAADQMSVKVRSDAGASVVSRIVPINPLPDGRAWQFQVVTSPVDSGGYSVTAGLDVTHLGRAFTSSANGPAAHLEMLPPPPVPGTPAWVYAAVAAGALVLVLGSALAVNARRQVPVGYLYDDKGRMLFDFSMTKQSPLRRLLARNIVACAGISGLPVATGSFLFGKRSVELRYPARNQSLRVNGRPAGNRVRLTPGTWLGVGGRLMTYSIDRKRRDMPQAQPGQEKDSPSVLTPAKPPVRRVMPGYVPGRLQPSREQGQASPEHLGGAERRREDEPPAEAASSPAPAGD